MVRNAGSYILALALLSQLMIATLSAGANPTTSAGADPTTSAAANPTTSAAAPTTSAAAPITSAAAAPTTSAAAALTTSAAAAPTTSTAAAPTTSAAAAPTTSAAAAPMTSAAAAPTTSAAAAPTTSAAASPTTSVAVASTSFSAAPSPTLMVSSSNIKSSSQVLPSASLSSMDLPTSSVAQSSIASASATPRLSSTMISSSQIVYSSSVMSSIVSSSALPFITPSRTAVIASESIQIKDKENKTCLTAQLEVDFKIVFYTKVNKTKQQQKTTIPLNGDNTTRIVNGSCSISERKAYFKISWNEYGNVSGPHHTFTMKFILNKTTRKWSVPYVSAVFQTADSRFHGYYKNDSSINAVLGPKTKNVFGSTKNGTNYVCNGQVEQKMTSNVTAMFKKIILQPFSEDPKLKDEGKHCAADKRPDDDGDNTVPIAVGAALGGLVLIVLVAYVVGRRRSSRGYEQV